jgi:hypothetical protein
MAASGHFPEYNDPHCFADLGFEQVFPLFLTFILLTYISSVANYSNRYPELERP